MSVGGSNLRRLGRYWSLGACWVRPCTMTTHRTPRRAPVTSRHSRTTGRAESGSFLAIPHAVLNSPNYLALSAHAVKLLFDMAAGFKGGNNGDLCAAWSLMKERGWKSRDTLDKARHQLLYYGLIELTRQGGLHQASLYAMTWWAIDECKGKLDIAPTRVASGLWKVTKPPFVPKRKGTAGTTPNTPGVSVKPGPRVNHRPVSPPAVSLDTPTVSIRAFSRPA